jgi:hypothetical protein
MYPARSILVSCRRSLAPNPTVARSPKGWASAIALHHAVGSTIDAMPEFHWAPTAWR